MHAPGHASVGVDCGARAFGHSHLALLFLLIVLIFISMATINKSLEG